MTATVKIFRLTGAGEDRTDVTGVNSRFDASDSYTAAGISSPIKVPTAGTAYSYWQSFYVVASGVFTQVDNIKFYSDGSVNLGTGMTVKVATADGYTQATGYTGSGLQLTDANYSGGTLTPSTPAAASTYTSGSPLSVSGVLTSDTDNSAYVVMQLEVGSTAGAGASSSTTFTYQYDEI